MSSSELEEPNAKRVPIAHATLHPTPSPLSALSLPNTTRPQRAQWIALL